jgi:hypothetical protein
MPERNRVMREGMNYHSIKANYRRVGTHDRDAGKMFKQAQDMPLATVAGVAVVSLNKN